MGKIDPTWSNQESLDQTQTLDLTIDPLKNNGQPPPAVMISRTIQAIVRRCLKLAITLRFTRCRCKLSPISALETETFPSVTKLVIYVGSQNPQYSQPDSRAIDGCQPSARFWRPFVNGMAFPDCKDLEIHHYWETVPSVNKSLDLNRTYPPHINGNYYPSLTQQIGDTDGLKRFERIILECPPELNPPLLMQLLGNPNAVASNLTNLELRFCNLAYETYSKLLYHLPPKVNRLILLCCDNEGFGYHRHYSEEVPHLCPLVRELSRRLVHLEFGASDICRDLFFDDLEKDSLKRDGIETEVGRDGGRSDKGPGQIDRHAMRETVEACRRRKRTRYRDDQIKEAIATVKPRQYSSPAPKSLFGGSNAGNISHATIRAQRETETLLDEQEERRRRLIQGSKTPWFRRFIAYRGLCNAGGTWAELQVAAEMEEKGIKIVLANKHLHCASRHTNDRESIDIDVEEAFREKFDFGVGVGVNRLDH